MENLFFIDYIKLRLKGRRLNSPMGDLLDDMGSDLRKLEELQTLDAITSHIAFQACPGCWEVFKRFRSQYRRYCRANDYIADNEKQ